MTVENGILFMAAVAAGHHAGQNPHLGNSVLGMATSTPGCTHIADIMTPVAGLAVSALQLHTPTAVSRIGTIVHMAGRTDQITAIDGISPPQMLGMRAGRRVGCAVTQGAVGGVHIPIGFVAGARRIVAVEVGAGIAAVVVRGAVEPGAAAALVVNAVVDLDSNAGGIEIFISLVADLVRVADHILTVIVVESRSLGFECAMTSGALGSDVEMGVVPGTQRQSCAQGASVGLIAGRSGIHRIVMAGIAGQSVGVVPGSVGLA